MNTQVTHSRVHSRRALLGAVLIILPATILAMLMTGGNAQADELPPGSVTPMPFSFSTPVPFPTEASSLALDQAVGPIGDEQSYIELRLTGGAATAVTIVQWQDPQGGWHDVDGWQTPAHSLVRWAVYPRDFNTGPFRWAVYAGRDSEHTGKLIAASNAFRLPCCVNATVVREIVVR